MGAVQGPAPLASMEDLSHSQFSTPQHTPAPSPRTRQRWSHRSELGVILDESEDGTEEEEEDEDDEEEEPAPVVAMPVLVVTKGEERLSLRTRADGSLVSPVARTNGAVNCPARGQLTASPLPTTQTAGQYLPTTQTTGQYLPTTQTAGQYLPTTHVTGQYLPATLTASNSRPGGSGTPRPVSRGLLRGNMPPCSPPPPPRGALSPSPRALAHSTPLLRETQQAHLTQSTPLLQDTQFLTPRRKYRRRQEVQERDYMQLAGGREKQVARDRHGLVFLSFLFHGLAAGLAPALLLTSDTFRQGLVAGCSPCPSLPWLASPSTLLIVTTAAQLMGAAPASLLPLRWFPLRVSLSLGGLVLTLLLLLLSVMGGLGAQPLLPLLLLHSLLSGLHCTAVLGLAARLPHLYPGAVLLGMGLAGVVGALLVCAQLQSGLSPRMTLVYGLILLLAIHLAAFDIHFALPLNTFYQHQAGFRAVSQPQAPVLTWSHLHLYLSSLLTYLVLPGVLHGISPLSPSWLNSPFFSPLLGFANFHLSYSTGVFSAIFSLLPSWWLLALLTSVRLLLLPLLLLANLLPAVRLLPVLLTWDWTLVLSLTLAGLLGGYLTAGTFMASVRQSCPQGRSLGAMRSYLVLLLGALTGGALSLLTPTLLQITV